MARLNEPVAVPDGLEILRRKFLRQNRDMARINSTQSLRIRSLENECARMLSENLDLRGQILRLETELRESRAQRIADHALEIREKMEAQLLEWGSMLASLGHEPVPKNRSPRAAKKLRRDPSLGLTSPRFRRRNTDELEAAAQHEGRLPPLWENKSCPRESLNREEILALCSEETEPEDSPDLGPPPVSRFVDEDPVKIDLPTKPLLDASNALSVEESLSKSLPKEPSKPAREENEVMSDSMDTVTSQPQPEPTGSLPAPEPQVPKVNLKRKMRDDDEKENARDVKGGGIVISAKSQPEKQALVEDRTSNRPIKNITSATKDGREKAAPVAPAVATRKPLGAKNANQVVSSSKKPSGKSPILDEIARAKAEVKEAAKAKDRAKPKKDETPLPVHAPSPEPVQAPMEVVEIEPETLSPAHEPRGPDSPELAVPREAARDTPPPADISSRGEISRPNRRARASVSYAEPNLRDKMRRPTKQLFDAVAGEGKAMRRTSHSRISELPSIKSEEKSQGGWEDAPKAAPASPLVQKVSRAQFSEKEKEQEEINSHPATVETTKKKRNSSMAPQGAESEGPAPSSRSLGKPTNRRLEEIAQREAEAAKMFDSEADVYEFSCSPTSDSAKHPLATAPPATEAAKKSSSGKKGRPARRLSSIIREDLGLSETATQEKAARGGRKRASMTAQKAAAAASLRLDADDSTAEADSSFNSASSGDTEPSTRDRVTMRRRSMML